MTLLAKKHLFKIEPYKPGKPIEEVKREFGLKRAIKLASNENPLGPSKLVISRLKKAIPDLNRYPDGGCFYLKRKLAQRFGLKAENFIIGNGSDEIITLAIRAFVKTGEEVVIAHPTFLIYETASKVAGVKIRRVPLKNFRYDLISMKRAVTKNTKIVFIANPDNPTGTYATAKEVERFMAGLRKGVIVFFDEAYYEFGNENRDYPQTLKFLKDKDVVITRSFSKIYSLAGLRVGYGIAGKALVEAMEKVREPFNVNSLAQEAALAALDDKRFVVKSLSLVRKGKKFLYKELEALKVSYIPSTTNFVLVRLGRSAEKIYNRLLEKGVIVRYMGSWGLGDFIRVTIGTMDENGRFVRVLENTLEKSKR